MLGTPLLQAILMTLQKKLKLKKWRESSIETKSVENKGQHNKSKDAGRIKYSLMQLACFAPASMPPLDCFLIMLV